MYRRNFTFGLAELQNPTDGNAWTPGNNPAKSWTLAGTGQFPPGTDGHDLSSIACAVNIFGQDNVFRQSFNALCFNGGSINSGRGELDTAESVSGRYWEYGLIDDGIL